MKEKIDKIEKDFTEAGKTPYETSDNRTDLALSAIKEASQWLHTYLGTVSFENRIYKTLEMDIGREEPFSILNCQTFFHSNQLGTCRVQVSNPLYQDSPRYYTRLFNEKLYWTEKKVIKQSDLLDGFVLFHIFKRDLDSIIEYWKKHKADNKVVDIIISNYSEVRESESEKRDFYDRIVAKMLSQEGLKSV